MLMVESVMHADGSGSACHPNQGSQIDHRLNASAALHTSPAEQGTCVGFQIPRTTKMLATHMMRTWHGA